MMRTIVPWIKSDGQSECTSFVTIRAKVEYSVTVFRFFRREGSWMWNCGDCPFGQRVSYSERKRLEIITCQQLITLYLNTVAALIPLREAVDKVLVQAAFPGNEIPVLRHRIVVFYFAKIISVMLPRHCYYRVGKLTVKIVPCYFLCPVGHWRGGLTVTGMLVPTQWEAGKQWLAC